MGFPRGGPVVGNGNGPSLCGFVGIKQSTFSEQRLQTSHRCYKVGLMVFISVEGLPCHAWAECYIDSTVQQPLPPLCFREGQALILRALPLGQTRSIPFCIMLYQKKHN